MDGNSHTISQIQIDGCNSVIFGPMAFNHEVLLNVSDVETVHVFQDAFAQTTFKVQFLRVADLRIHVGAFTGANMNARLNVVDSMIVALWPLQAVIGEIVFERTKIRSIRSNAFNTFGMDNVEFRNCVIDVVEKDAFTKNVSYFIQYLPLKES